MLEDKLPQLVRSTFNFKILVSATYKAKQTLAAKGLTPAIFLDRFYKQKNKDTSEISYYFSKDRYMKPLPDFVPIDFDECAFCRRQQKDGYVEDLEQQKISKKLHTQLTNQQVKMEKGINKDIFRDRQNVEKFLNNQSFHWFQKINRIFYHVLTLSQSGFKVSMVDQPIAIVYMIQVQKQKNLKQTFGKIKKQTEDLLKKSYFLNPQQIKHVKIILIIVYDNFQAIEDALQYRAILKNQFNINQKYILKIPINDQNSQDSAEWGHYNRPLLHFDYKLRSSDPIRIVSQKTFQQLQDFIDKHKIEIRKNMENRLTQLLRKFQQINKTSNKLMSFFKGNSVPNLPKYSEEQTELRQLADRMFVIEDYKRAYQVYKHLAGKLQNRNPMIEINISQMIQYCLAMSKYHGIKLRSDPYGSIEKYSSMIFTKYYQRSRLRHIRYLIFMTYVFHTFKNFNRSYIKNVFYTQIKNGFNSSMSLPTLLVYEQYANMNLFFGKYIVQYRKYCYDLTRVASRFSQFKLHMYSLRCFMIIEQLYKESFSAIQKYEAIQLSHLHLELKNYKQSVRYLRKAWEIYDQRIQSQQLQKDQADIIKLMDNISKIIKQLDKYGPQYLQMIIQPNLRIPIVQSLTVQVYDELLKHDQKSGVKWEDIGEIFIDNKEFMSQGLSQKLFGNIFRSFDTGIAQQKYLIHRFKSGIINQSILKKNSRVSYVNQPIRVSFYFRNPIRTQIEVEKVSLELKNFGDVDIAIKRSQNIIKPFQSSKFTFLITPKAPGYLQIHRIKWHFMKMLTQHIIRQPEQIMSHYKSCYYKLNIQPQVGALQSQATFQEYYYQGQRSKMKLTLKNVGVKPIDKVFVAVGDSDIFGFSYKDLQISIEPEDHQIIYLPIQIPSIGKSIQSGQQKKLIKTLILYQTGDKFRISRTISRFSVVRVAKLNKFSCQRLSNHLHLLSFVHTTEQSRRQNIDLEWMVITHGFQIVKNQAAQLSKQTSYFFFLKKGQYLQQKYAFNRSNQSSINMYPQNLLESEVSNDENQKNVQIKFLWRKDNKYGCLYPPLIPITINPYSCISTVFPINVKLQYQEQIQHNFSEKMYLEIPIVMKLKNIFKEEQYKVSIFFIQSKDPAYSCDAVWQGISQKKVTLAATEVKTQINLIVIRPGIYDISTMIRYSIENQKGKLINVSHNQYERVFIKIVDNNKVTEQQPKDHTKEFAMFQFFTDPSKTAEISTSQLPIQNQNLLQEHQQIEQQKQEPDNDSLI